MSLVNYYTKEVHCKIVYFGPGLGGKTSNIQYIYQKTGGKDIGPLVNLNTANERTLFFDFLPLDLGLIRGFKTRLHLYSVPGQSFYQVSRNLIMRGVDGVVFVADSQLERMESNLESLSGLENILTNQGSRLQDIPFVIQFNKRDLPNISSMDELRKQVNKFKVPDYGAVATTGEGVFDTLKALSKLVLMNVRCGIKQ